MLYFASFLALVAIILLWLASRQQKRSGMPGGKLLYSDTSAWIPVHDPLYNAELGLTGKPDYLVEQDGQVIPVEVKSSRIDQGPYDTHIYQLAAYCLLVDRIYGTRPAYGILHYPNRTYRIDFTTELESATLTLLEEIHQQEHRKVLLRSHENPARCRACGFRDACDQRLS
jgi:CRISPR-associated exonuclease Cas4